MLAVALAALGLRTAWQLIRGPSAVHGGRPGARREPVNVSDQKRAQFIASSVVIALISIPLILEMVPPNGIYGFRTALTRSSPAIWYRANAFMGWALLLATMVSASALVMLPAPTKRWIIAAAFLVPVTGAIVASMTYLKWLT